jgi:tRNA-splicing ligase RtcB (3'-phosphate/5'-hydroxy nucleic acid ligase)
VVRDTHGAEAGRPARPPLRITDRLHSWASILDPATEAQAEALSRLPIIDGHVALMPDAHLGKGSTVGSVIPTRGAVIPAAIGVDIGCGMIAARTDLGASDLPDSLDRFVAAMERVVPAGLGRWHAEPKDEALRWYATNRNTRLTAAQERRALVQLGTMGGGNHFFEVALDEDQAVWILMHSGSRGVGNQLATHHMGVARAVCDFDFLALRGSREDRDLAWLNEGTKEFAEYIGDMLWAQSYAMANRRLMMNAALEWFFAWLGAGTELQRINCHHNFTQREAHDGVEVWVTRKGAIRAGANDLGLIPGAMGARSYVVRGRGNQLSYESCAHGAGRRLSRSAARKALSIDSLHRAMAGRSWQSEFAAALVDEHPDAYKPIDIVMADQADLVEVLHELHGIATYKGTS